MNIISVSNKKLIANESEGELLCLLKSGLHGVSEMSTSFSKLTWLTNFNFQKNDTKTSNEHKEKSRKDSCSNTIGGGW